MDNEKAKPTTMEIVRRQETDQRGGRKVYTVQPFPRTRPDLIVGLYRLMEPEVNKIWDKRNFVPGHRSVTMGKIRKVSEDQVLAAVAHHSGFTQGGAPYPQPEDDPEGNVYLFLDHEFEDEDTGKLTSLWAICDGRLAEKVRADAKN